MESHDNYSNKPDDYGASMKMSEWEMTMGWGVIGSRSQTMPLYFDRPVGSGGNQPQFAEKSQLGDAGSDSWKDSQVVAVNHFRNKMNNAKAKEYMRNCGDNSCLMVERYIKDGNADSDGVTVVNMNGDKSLAGTETTLDDGTYTDQVNGGTLTVSGGKITSGTAKGGKISVFYNSNLASVSANPTGGSFKTDTTKVTLHASNVTSASYTTSEGSSGSYQDGDTIAIGAKTAVNGTITLKLQGTDKDGKTVSAEYTFTKKDPAAVSIAYAKKPSNWSNLYAYVYVDDSSAATLKQNAKWPGVAMTKVSAGDSCGKDGEYKYEIPDGFDENVRIIFNDGNATNTLKYPADTAEGEDAAGLSIDGTYAWNGDTTASGTWTARSCAVVTVNSVKINQKDFTTDLTNGAKTIKLTATTDPAGVNVSWSSSNETVAKVASDGTVTPVKAGTAKITAKAGGKTASITVTVTGVPPLDPVGKNTIYATKPSGWGDLYAYVYTGDGATAANNAAWPGVKMTATTASDGCRQANAYRYVVPDDLAKGAKVIFNDGGSNQYPGSREPGIAYDGGIVKWDGATAALPALDCPTDVPVTSVSISGPGVKDGKATVRRNASLQLAATVSPGNATDRTVAWKSGDTAVATVDKAGKVTGVKAGKATITATAGGKSASVEVTVEEPQTTVQITFDAAADLKAGETLYAVGDWGQGKGKIWNRAGGVRLAGADGSYTGTTTVAKGHSVTARLVKVTADGKTEWDKIGDMKATADSSKTVSLKWDENAGKTVGITINAAADLKAGETLYAVGDWGQGKGKIWNRAGGVRLAQSGSIYTGTAKVDRNHAMTFRLIKVDASGRTTWDPTTDRKTTADKTKSIGVTWSINKVNEDGSIPDGNEFYITGKGVENGKLTMQAHHLAELNLVGASTSDKVTWWSDSAAVAVSGTGTVYAVQKGAAKVSAKVGTKIASVDVTVEDNSVNKVSSVTIAGDGVSNGKLSIVAGKNIQLNATVLPENATNKTVSWTSSNSSVVNVMGTGVLTTAKAGTATITATADGVSAKVAVTVTAAPNPFNDDIVIAGAESGKVIGSEQFQLTAREKDGSSFANVEWSIPDTNLLMFINKGFSKTTTGRTVGLKAQYDLSRHDYVDTVISVKATRTDGTVLTAQKKISVGGSDSVSDSDPLDSLTPSADGLTKTGDNEYTITIPAGSSKHVSVTALPSNARQLPLWKELGGDDTVATVDADGTIYAHKAGTFATSANNYNRYFQLTVVVE
ncbi:MAG: starch-binding protein [Bifidobacterium angulatum]